MMTNKMPYQGRYDFYAAYNLILCVDTFAHAWVMMASNSNFFQFFLQCKRPKDHGECDMKASHFTKMVTEIPNLESLQNSVAFLWCIF